MATLSRDNLAHYFNKLAREVSSSHTKESRGGRSPFKILSTGIGWAKLPTELGHGSGWTCWRRMREWAEAGVFDRLHQAVLDRLGEQGRLDWSRASLDSVSVRAKRGVH
jgi:transposase